MKAAIRAAAATLAATLCFQASAEAQVNLRLATLAPNGSSWHVTLRKMAADIGRDTDGEVRLRIIGGGSAGDESDMIRKMRIGQVQMAAVSNVGLSELDPSAWTLSIPMVFADYEEWDHVRDVMNPSLGEAFQEHGFRALAWADVGWLHFFSSEPVRTVEDLKGLRLAGAAGDPTALDLLRWAGFDPVQVNSVELVSGFQTGLVEAAPLPIAYAEGSQVYRSAKFMNSLRWAPLQAALIIHDNGWERLTPEQQAIVSRHADAAATTFRSSNRDTEAKSLAAMKRRDLEVVEASDQFRAEWERLAEDLIPMVREQLVPGPVLDRVIRIRDEFRAGAGGSGR